MIERIRLPAETGLVMFSPMPPKQNGIADYTFELLSGLAREIKCTVVVDAGDESSVAPPEVSLISLIEYVHNKKKYRDCLHVYQVGNNPDHAYLLPHMVRRPGLVVLHDPALHHLLHVVTAQRGDKSRYADALGAEHGLAGQMLGEQFQRLNLREERMFFDMPVIRGVLGPALGVIVHSYYAEAKVLARVPEAQTTVVPHQFIPPGLDKVTTSTAVRRALGVDEDEILLLSLGFVTRAKKIDAALRALAKVRAEMPPFKYVIAGELSPEHFDVERLIRALGLDDCVIPLGYVEERHFFELAVSSDIVINLRHPIGGETSGTMIRSLGVGACVIVVDRGPFAELPDDAVRKIPWGRRFEAELAEAILELAADKTLRESLSEKAQAYISAQNSLDKTVGGYRIAIAKALKITRLPWATHADWHFLTSQRLAALVTKVGASRRKPLPLWFTAGALPIFDVEDLAMVWLAGDQDLDLLEKLPESVIRHTASDWRSYDRRSIDLAVMVVSFSDDLRKLACDVININKALKFGALLVVDVVSKGDAYRPPSYRRDFARLFAEGGFRIQAYMTGPPPGGEADPVANHCGPKVEQRCWRLVKVTETITSGGFLGELDTFLQNAIKLGVES